MNPFPSLSLGLFLLLTVMGGAADVHAQAALSERLESAHADYLRSRSEDVDLDALLVELDELAEGFVAAGEDSMAILALRDAGDLHLRAGRLELCREFFERGVAIAASAGRPGDEAHLRSNIAVSWAMGGDFEGMIADTREVLSLARTLGDQGLEWRCWFNICVAYTKLGRTPEALVAIRHALPLAHELENVERMCSTYSMVSELQLTMGHIDLARDSAESAVEYGRRAGSRLPLSAALLGRAAAKWELGDLPGAWNDAQEAVELRRGSGLDGYLPLALLNRARIELAMHDYEKCRQTLDELMPMALEQGDPTQTMEARHVSALIELELGRLEEAERKLLALRDEYEALLPDVEDEASAAGLYQIGGEAYGGLARVYALQGEPVRGWRTVERGSAPQLRRRLGMASQALTQSDLAERLGAERAILLHFADSQQMPLSVFVATPDTIEFHELGSWLQISTRCREVVRRLILSPDGTSLDDELHSLSELLLGPFASILAGDDLERIFVVLPSALAGFPLEILPLPGSSGTAIGERFAVSHIPYAGLLAEPDPGRTSEAILAVADPAIQSAAPDESAPELARLPSAREEIAIFVGDGVEILVDEAATVDALVASIEASNPAVIHLATHAIVSPDVPENSILVLAGEEGRLRAGQIETWDLDCELVTLSACRTAVGYAYMGEGSFSLARSFLVAGARSVVSSLWEVEDSATARLMEDFYGALAEGAPRDEALRRARASAAQRGMSRRDRGAFVLAGVGWEPVPAVEGRIRTSSQLPRVLALAGVGLVLCGVTVRFARSRRRHSA